MKKTPEERREYMRQYMARRRQDPVFAQQNRDSVRKWQEANREKSRDHSRRWREKNPEAVKKHNAAWRARHTPEELAAYDRESYRRYKRALHLKNKFDITEEQYSEMLTAQNHKCALCDRTDSPTKRLAVDHNHATGKVRALLCDRCNRGIGLLDEDTTRLRAAIDYLEQYCG
jgi:Recombination endonuclease VII